MPRSRKACERQSSECESAFPACGLPRRSVSRRRELEAERPTYPHPLTLQMQQSVFSHS